MMTMFTIVRAAPFCLRSVSQGSCCTAAEAERPDTQRGRCSGNDNPKLIAVEVDGDELSAGALEPLLIT
jgi:hypothetical protein